MNLFYHRCDDCLTAFSSTERTVHTCDCDGHVTYMGQISGNIYKKVGNRPICDGRCTHSRGPVCDCECGGVNHGTGRMVATVIREGKVKVVDPSVDILDEMKRGYKYREFRDYAQKQVNAIMEHWARKPAQRILDKIVAGRVYDKRLKELVDFIVRHKR